jgi:hypothetical protein
VFQVRILASINLAFAPSWVSIGHLLKLKYPLGTLEFVYFSFNKCPIETHNGANAKVSTN